MPSLHWPKQKVMQLYDRFAYFKYRARMKRSGVTIHQSAVFHGIEHIQIASGTIVGAHSLIVTGHAMQECRIHGRPKGNISIGAECEIHCGVIIATYGGTISIGNNVSVNPYSLIYGHGGLSIGDNTRIAGHTVIIPANHVFEDECAPIRKQGLTQEGISIGRDVWIGCGVRILDGVQIADGAVIGAGTVVTHDIDRNAIAVGVPARTVGRRGVTDGAEKSTVPLDIAQNHD